MNKFDWENINPLYIFSFIFLVCWSSCVYSCEANENRKHESELTRQKIEMMKLDCKKEQDK
jgi:hypothetical protein